MSNNTNFDLRSHIRDPKSGKILEEQHYAAHVSSEGTVYERPIGSGMMYLLSGEPTAETLKKISREEANQKLAALQKVETKSALKQEVK